MVKGISISFQVTKSIFLLAITIFAGTVFLHGKTFFRRQAKLANAAINVYIAQCGDTGTRELMRGLVTLHPKVDPGAFRGQRQG